MRYENRWNARPTRWAAVACTLAAACCTSARADDAAPPLVTAKTAEQYADKPAALETTVVDVKFAERRQLYFLSATVNFRSDSNLPVAIRAADIGAFHTAGIKDLAAHYKGKTIRARGTIVRDEGQWLLVVTSPEHIELLEGTAKAATSTELVVVNCDGRRTTLKVPLTAELPRSKLSVQREGKTETYEGVAVAALLERADVPLGAEARGTLLGRYIVVTGQDGYAATFSVAEVDPHFARDPALLADRLNGEGLPASQGPLRLVVPADKHRRRWVSQVVSIEVRNALDKPPIGR